MQQSIAYDMQQTVEVPKSIITCSIQIERQVDSEVFLPVTQVPPPITRMFFFDAG